MANAYVSVQGYDSASYESVKSVEIRPRICRRDAIVLALCLMVYFCTTAVFSLLGPFFPIEVKDISVWPCDVCA